MKNNRKINSIITMVDLTQRKLTKAEWTNIEVKLPDNELDILKMLVASYHDTTYSINKTHSLITFVKTEFSDKMEEYLFIKYFQDFIAKMIKKFGLEFKMPTVSSSKVKKSDVIRISNVEQNLMTNKEIIFEFIILQMCDYMLRAYKKKDEKWLFHYYTILAISKYNIKHKNKFVSAFIDFALAQYGKYTSVKEIVYNSHEIIEKNPNILRYADISLYEHQKEIFSAIKRPGAKLILYTAPTGTGKTLTPIGLSEEKRVIFVCAARHVGLALAKASISINKKIAFAFGCNDITDIRLHYFAAKEYTTNKRSGGIHKVDNSVGDKVEIMICDLKSYTYAMYYMLAFNKPEDVVMYWDEPTITLDYDEHSLHDIIKDNWKKNTIPNIVLSSATLPKKDDIGPAIANFKSKFMESEVIDIQSFDCKKTISLYNKSGAPELPHLRYEHYDMVIQSARFCQEFKTLLRYFDLKSIILFIKFVNEHGYFKHERFNISNNFDSFRDITINNIKLYYLHLLQHVIKDRWTEIYNYCKHHTLTPYDSNIHITTKDAYTLTSGPTIFLTRDIEKAAKVYLKESKIPDLVIKNIYENIKFNNTVNKKIEKLEKDIEDAVNKAKESKSKDGGKEDKGKSDADVPQGVKKMMEDVDSLRKCVKSISLHDMFVPNKRLHIDKWASNKTTEGVFTSDISPNIVESIMLLPDVEDSWKILLLMGIGVFAQGFNIAYMEIMKKLAEQQKLYLIIASDDFIYGTNYQFCHSYIARDLGDMSQEKAIQAMGRVGRQNIQHTYSVRLRDDALFDILFNEQSDKPEIRNMNRLFS